MGNYQTQSHLLLTILLQDAVEDIKLSNQRLQALKEMEDYESYADEMEVNEMYKEKVSKLQFLLKAEENSYCSKPTVVNIQWENEDGSVSPQLEYKSRKC